MDTKIMMEYLNFAFQMEQNVHILKKSLSKIEIEQKVFYNKLQNKKNEYNQNYYILKNSSVDESRFNSTEAEKKKFKKALKIMVFYLLILLALSISLVASLVMETDPIISSIFIFPLGFLGSLFPFLLYWFLFRLYKKKTSGKSAAGKTAQELIRANNIIESLKPQILADENQLTIYSKHINSIRNNLHNAQEELKLLYSKNYIPIKYQNIIAVGMMYGYLLNRRCTTIDGHGGIYDTFEIDMNFRDIRDRLDYIIDQNRDILSGQREIISALNNIDRKSEMIYSEVKSFHNDYNETEAEKLIRDNQINENLSYIRWSHYH